MISSPRSCRVILVLVALATASTANAQPSTSPPASSTTAVAPKAAPQGIAVLATSGTRDGAFALARAVYKSSLRPRALDELRARILAGDPAPAAASNEIRELAELRSSISGEDAPSRRLLSSIAQQIGVQALLVVSRAPARPSPKEVEPPEDAGAVGAGDAGASPTSDDPGAPPLGPDGTTSMVMARLFLAEIGEFDAARYEPDASGGWRGTVVSLSGRFRPPSGQPTAQLGAPAPKILAEGTEKKPFYASPWLWGAIGAAVLIGGFFFFASQDTSDDPIHLQLRVPR